MQHDMTDFLFNFLGMLTNQTYTKIQCRLHEGDRHEFVRNIFFKNSTEQKFKDEIIQKNVVTIKVTSKKVFFVQRSAPNVSFHAHKTLLSTK